VTDKTANVLSAIFHPLLMPTILFALLFYVSPETISNLPAYKNTTNAMHLGFKENLLFFIFLSTFITPSCFIYYLYKIKLISSLKMEDLKARRLPYLITTILYSMVCLLLFTKFSNLKEISICIMAITFSIFIVQIISFFWQISAHAVGIAGVFGLLATFTFYLNSENLFFPSLIFLILTGIIASARLKLNAHTPAQIIAGLVVGLFISISSIIIFL
jgi:hypothetical protein